ncbi:hypothetical protein HMPREF3200_00966 [Anaerococcus tetradius]|uniref:Oligosaccharide repeat unit polymerase n=2 Tax=Anaerococcus tetradius TaxID=33036 RepID=A0A133KEW0_9FIRM|nr:hypothetical protein HMPREF3200_00966 [Anaerococcus tetradius]
MIFLGFFQFFIIFIICILEYKANSPSVFLWSTLLVMFGIMHLVTCLTKNTIYQEFVLNEASIFVINFCLIYVVFRCLFNRKLMSLKSLSCDIKTTSNNNYQLLNFVLIIVIIYKIYEYVRFTGGIFNTSWGELNKYVENLSYFNLQQIADIFFYSLSGLIVINHINRKYALNFLVLFTILLNVIITRNRIEILPIFCSLISIYLIKHHNITLKTFISTFFIMICIIYLIYGLRVFRHYGTLSEFFTNFNLKEFNSKIIDYLVTGNGELGLRNDFYYFISRKNNFIDFNKGHTYLRMLFVFVPTSYSFGLKPDDFSISMGKAVGMGLGGSTHPTLFGDCYANFGIYGILLGIFWAMYVTFFNRVILNRSKSSWKIMHYILNAIVFVIIGRGSVYNAFFITAYGTLLLIFLELLSIKFKIKINKFNKLSIIYKV